MAKHDPQLIYANWQAPRHVHAFNTTRLGGCSEAPFNSLNLGLHVNDNPSHVRKNRQRVAQAAELPAEPHWMNQVHGCHVLEVDGIPRNSVSPVDSEQNNPATADICSAANGDAPDATANVKNAPHTAIEADAAFTQTKNEVLCVVTADCLPVAITNEAGTKLAVAHAGWKGLANGVLEASLAHFNEQETLYVWLGPAIGPERFEVGDEVKQAFVGKDQQQNKHFIPHPMEATKHYANLYGLATRVIARTVEEVGSIAHITGAQWCTYTDHTRFYSYRRDGQASGRMALIAWLSGHE